MKKTQTIAAIIILIILGSIYLYFKVPENGDTRVVNTVSFSCAESKTIDAIFFANKVQLSLSDGRYMNIPQVISASGARYANSDETFVFWNKGDTAFVTEGATTTYASCAISTTLTASTTVTAQNDDPGAKIANPASVNCSKQGGKLSILKNGSGSEYGLCTFEDNRACEEWALMRGECPVGGVKTTGFDTIDQNFCAWSGGQTIATTSSMCTFKNSSKCKTVDFYNGTCSATTN
ncbi:MAG: DUF333 domain-containing protein [Candidatus Taylorbacteria bacterium]